MAGLGPSLNHTSKKIAPRPPMKVENRVGIKAPCEVVWDILADLEGWGTWNPIYPKATGILRIDAPLQLTLALPGEAHREIMPKVVDWVPYEQILWADLGWRGWAKTLRYFEIEQVTQASCFFSNGELFEGTVCRWYGNSLRRSMKKGFAPLGEAIKERSEAVWQEQSGGAT